VTDHIQQHIQILKTADPALLGLLGEKSLAPPPPAAPGPGGPPPGVHPPGPAMPQMANATPPAQQAANQIKEPGMPGMPNLPKAAPAPSQEAYNQLKATA
jgi:hypothetical protein